MNPGDLRENITIQQKTVSGQNTSGEDVYTWTTVWACKANVLPMSGREIEAAQQKWAEARWKIKIHYPSVAIQRAMQIVWGVRIFDILDAEDPGGKRREFVMVAKEWVA